jgi:hypothetical protein
MYTANHMNVRAVVALRSTRSSPVRRRSSAGPKLGFRTDSIARHEDWS